MKIPPLSSPPPQDPSIKGISEEKRKKMWESAKKFEGYFVGFVFEKAYETVPKSELFEGSHEDMYTGMFIQQVSDQMTHSKRGMGLANQIYRELEKREGVKANDLSSSPGEPLSESYRTNLDAQNIGTDLAHVGMEKFKID